MLLKSTSPCYDFRACCLPSVLCPVSLIHREGARTLYLHNSENRDTIRFPTPQEMDLNKPALKPPPGIESNFDNPPNGNVQAHIGIAICIFVVFAGASLRAYSKIFCMKQVHLEDCELSLTYSLSPLDLILKIQSRRGAYSTCKGPVPIHMMRRC
jgi:hypothetical protein